MTTASPTYRKAVWAQVKAKVLRSDTPTHLFWAIAPPLITGAIAFFIAHREAKSLLIESAWGLGGVIATLAAYVVYLRLSAPREMWETDQLQRSKPGTSFEQNPSFIPNVNGVIPLVMSAIRTTEHSAAQLPLKVFGLDLETVTPWLHQIVTDPTKSNISIKLLMIDIESEAIKRVIDGPHSNVSSKTAEASLERIGELVKTGPLASRGLSLELRSYAAIPFFHGYMIDGKHLFIDFAEIKQGKIQASNYPYMQLEFDGRSAHVKHYFNVFDQWFEFYWKTGKPLVGST